MAHHLHHFAVGSLLLLVAGCGGGGTRPLATCTPSCAPEAYCDSHRTCQTTVQCQPGEFMTFTEYARDEQLLWSLDPAVCGTLDTCHSQTLPCESRPVFAISGWSSSSLAVRQEWDGCAVSVFGGASMDPPAKVPGTCRTDFRGDYVGTVSLRFLSDDGVSYSAWGNVGESFHHVGAVDGNRFDWRWCGQGLFPYCRRLSGTFDPPGWVSGSYVTDDDCGVHCPTGVLHSETVFVLARVSGP